MEIRSGDRIVARVDPEIREFIPEYISHRRSDAKKLGAALEAGDFDTLREIGHKLRGCGATYGFESISEFGLQIEKNATLKNHEQTRLAVDGLESYLARVEITFE